MTASPAEKVSALRKKLHESLSELHKTLQNSERQLSEHQELYFQWKLQWENQGSELTERLRLLDRRLKSSLGESTDGPRLNLVTDESHH